MGIFKNEPKTKNLRTYILRISCPKYPILANSITFKFVEKSSNLFDLYREGLIISVNCQTIIKEEFGRFYSISINEGIQELPLQGILTDPIYYTDIFGVSGYYRRIGRMIEFSASQPPKELNIITSTLTIDDNLRKAEVISWGNANIQECCLENEKVEAKIENAERCYDTHNFCILFGNKHVESTIPITGLYKVYYEKEFKKGDVIQFNNINKLTIKRDNK